MPMTPKGLELWRLKLLAREAQIINSDLLPLHKSEEREKLKREWLLYQKEAETIRNS